MEKNEEFRSEHRGLKLKLKKNSDEPLQMFKLKK